MKVFGIVLAGGLSRRMEGRDKAFVDFGGRSLLERVIERLAPQCQGIVLSANREAAWFERYALPVVADDVLDFAGPVAGLLAGLDWIAERCPGVDVAASCAVDTPFLPRDLVERLRQARERGNTAVACAASGGRRHPVAALWPVVGRHRIRDVLERAGERRLSALADALGCTQAEWLTDPFDPFVNVNTPADLEIARQWLTLEDGC